MLNFALITHSKQKTNKKQFYLCWFRVEIIVNFSSSFVGWKQPPSIISYTLTPTVNSGLIEKKNKNAFVGSKCSWLMLLELFFTIPTLQLERLSYAFAQHTVYLCVFLFSQCAFDFVSFHNFTQFSHSSHNLKNLLVVRGKKKIWLKCTKKLFPVYLFVLHFALISWICVLFSTICSASFCLFRIWVFLRSYFFFIFSLNLNLVYEIPSHSLKNRSLHTTQNNQHEQASVAVCGERKKINNSTGSDDDNVRERWKT